MTTKKLYLHPKAVIFITIAFALILGFGPLRDFGGQPKPAQAQVPVEASLDDKRSEIQKRLDELENKDKKIELDKQITKKDLEKIELEKQKQELTDPKD